MKGSIRLVGINVTDLRVSQPFYAQVLGFLNYTQIEDLPHSKTWMHPSGSLLALFPTKGRRPADGSGEDLPGFQRIAFNVVSREEVDAFYGLLRELEADVTAAPAEYPFAPGYYSVFFRDPDAELLEVVHIADDG